MKLKTLVLLIPLALLQNGCSFAKDSKASPKNVPILFSDVTEEVGIRSSPSWKYGGPAIADLNGDGRYELMLGNHDRVPAQLFWAKADNTYTEHHEAIAQWDLHGIAAGDYDNDGDGDIIIAMGGGNGANPKPPRFIQNNNGEFKDVTQSSGIAEMGARGRSARWIDLDSDGDLDLLQINAAQLQSETGPRNLLFENLGDGTFTYRSSAVFDQLDAEKVLVSDFNGDHIPDLVAFSPLQFLQGNNDFTFTDVTQSRLPKGFEDDDFISAVAEADIDNDGDLDYYVARGKTYYQIANNAVSFNPQTTRLDLRDEGNKSHDGISFDAEGDVVLSDFWHWPRNIKVTFPVFLGKNKVALDTPTSSVTVTQQEALGFPDSVQENGWYLGYLGNGKWRMEWKLNGNLAWDIRASVTGLTSVTPDWEPQHLGVQDLLLRNDGDTFTDISTKLPALSGDNNWGVITGDFNNDTFQDFFIYRFGELKTRIADVLIVNEGSEMFSQRLDHQANVLSDGGHGDMGAAFDYNQDGDLDIFSGDDDDGKWRLYRNLGSSNTHSYVHAHIGYSRNGVDPIGAEVKVTTKSGSQFKRIGSGSATHSQSTLNMAHFGLGHDTKIERIQVRWRDGTTAQLTGVDANKIHVFGTPNPQP
ncbi:CRTAC1 family protein [Echinimonas agarilytica]|uniref:CRTAC1 family protein n=1 Tax=Echinimonas agarilytica TaxID=1215918 RepID=A0AA42B7B2_9GAMM|nr:CRTAC1 family protein [Echinimonas agarilytica]MCM2679719.1 CRTAC1 family protein [Echinimonas agarilytica]